MSRRKKDRGCGMIALVLLLFVLAGGVVGFVYVKRYMPSNELADKEKIFRIQDGRVALLLDNELQDARGIYEDGQVYLPVKWVNEHLNQRFYWDERERLLVYTLPDTIVYADENAMGEKGPLLKVTSEGMFLSLGLVLNYTGMRGIRWMCWSLWISGPESEPKTVMWDIWKTAGWREQEQ